MHRIIFQIGPFTLYAYGLMIAIGFLLGTVLILRDAKKSTLSQNDVFDCMIALLVGGLIGGRLLFVLINWDFYSEHLLRIVMLHEGGLAVQGAIAAGTISLIAAVKIKRISFWKMADIIVPYAALGQSIGRIGCFLNGCCCGKVIENGIGVVFPGETFMRMPTQVYLSFGLLMLFIVLIGLKDRPHSEGSIFAWYLILYSGFRFGMDLLRGDNLVMVRACFPSSGSTLRVQVRYGSFKGL